MRQRATMAILAALVAMPAFAAFSDVPASHWAKGAVDAATSGIIPILEAKDGKFNGTQPVTHADLLKGFGQVLVGIGANAKTMIDLNALKAANPTWKSIADSATKPLTRYELASIISGLYTDGAAKGIIDAKPGTIKFADLDKATAAQKDAVNTVANKFSIMKGSPDGKFHGEAAVSRYEFAALVQSILKSGWHPKAAPSAAPTAKPTAAPTAKPTPAPTAKPTPAPKAVTFPAYRLDAAAYGVPGLPALNNFAPVAVGSDAAASGLFGTPIKLGGTFNGRQDIGNFFIGEKVAYQPAGASTLSAFSLDGQVKFGYNINAGDNVRFRPYIGGGAMYNTSFGAAAAGNRDTLIPHAGYGLIFDAKTLSWLGFSVELANKHAISAMNLGGTGSVPGMGAMMPSANVYFDLYPTDNFAISLGYGFLGMPDMTGGSNLLMQHGPTLGLTLAY
jgi:hypothetical protein